MSNEVITNGTTVTYTEKGINGRFFLHTKGTFGAGSLTINVDGGALESGVFTDNVSKEIFLSGDVDLILSGATDVTVYFSLVTQ